MPNRTLYCFSQLAIAGLLLIAQVGCTGTSFLNRMHHDSPHCGGVGGACSGHCGAADGCSEVAPCSASACSSCNDSDCGVWFECCDTGCFEEEELPEIPWPRYHPVPTRPVFGPAPLGR